MPERQSSSGEVTAHPEKAPDYEQPGSNREPVGREDPTVAAQVVEQIDAAPDASEPAPARPSDAAPDPAAPVADGPALAADGDPVTEPDADESPTIAAPRTTDGLGSWFASSDGEATQVLPRAADDPAAGSPDTGRAPGVDAPTERIRPVAPPPPPADDTPEAAESGSPRKKGLLMAAGAVVLVGLLYSGDLLLSSGSVPRGTSVAGVAVGGLSLTDAEQTLRTKIEPRTTEPVAVTAGDARSDLDPRTAGLSVDWKATLDRAGSQPLNPITRITSFFTTREVGVATSTDRSALDAALAQLAPIVDKAPVEGTVRFDGATPTAVDPVAGQQLDAPGAAAVLERDWASGAPIALPITQVQATTTADDVATAIERVAKPAVSAPLVVVGEKGTQGTLAPGVIAKALSFKADQTGLVPAINQGAVIDALKPQLAASEQPGRDATLDFSSGSGVVVPSQDGRGIDYPATLRDLLPVLTGTGERKITAIYADQPAKLTTEQLKSLGISGVIGEFKTGGFAADSGQNIKRAAEVLNGKIVQPGQTFGLNAATNPRDAAHGYVEAGIIDGGRSSRGIGGGVSQVATTLFNASYFAGMADIRHQEHSFYISRYPPGREATVFEGSIDLRFRNDNPTAVMIQTVWTPTSLTVRIVGTKVWEVTTKAGPRTNPTTPNTVSVPAGEKCSPGKGAPGFTITNTRTLKNVKTGEVRVDPTRTTRYNPSPIVVCG